MTRNSKFRKRSTPWSEGSVRPDFDMDDHRIDLIDLCLKHGTDLRSGLSQAAAEAHLFRDGKNLVHPDRRSHEIQRFFRVLFLCRFSVTVWIAVAFSIAVVVIGHVIFRQIIYTTFYILFALLFNLSFVVVCYYYQSRNRHYMEMVPNVSRDEVEVIRNGQRKKIAAIDVVVGDLILLKFGDRIPADIRIVESQNFKVDNFTLTGTHDPQQVHEKTTETNPLESPNVVFFSAHAVEGSARGIVIRTGPHTLMGRILSVRVENDIVVCPITVQVFAALNKSALFAFVNAVFILLAGLALYHHEFFYIILSVLVYTAMIPEEIFRTVSASYKIYCRKMSNRSCWLCDPVVMQRLPFVKTICLNKSAILTMNKMSVSNLWMDRKKIEVWGGTKMIGKDRRSSTFKELARGVVLSIEADFVADENNENQPLAKRQISGTPTEVTLFKFLAHVMGKKVDRLRQAYPRLLYIPYSQVHKYHVSVHALDNSILVILMGEPEYLLEKCGTYAMSGRSATIGNGFRRDIDEACTAFAAAGDSLKCVVERTLPINPDLFEIRQFRVPESGYRFLGIVALSDVPRPNIAQTVTKCRAAGIKVILTTNDHPITARTFARAIGVITDSSLTMEERFASKSTVNDGRQVNSIVIDGFQLKNLSTRVIQKLIEMYPEVVFARTSPMQKLMLVAMCQESNSLVAVVGDGVDDVPTMKKADVSIRLNDGKRRECNARVDLELTDDTLYSIASCIQECRTVYANLKKSSAYILTSNVPSIVAIMAYFFVGLPLPVSPVGLVVVECIMDVLPAIALVFEKEERDVMEEPPSKMRRGGFFSRQMIFYSCFHIGVIEAFACFFTYFVIMIEFGWEPSSLIGIRSQWDSPVVTDLEDRFGQKWTYAARKHLEGLSQTGYFYALMLTQCVNIFICRNQSKSLFNFKTRNWFVHFSLLFELSLTFFFIYIPGVNDFVQMRPLKPLWWIVPLPYVAFLIMYDEFKKFLVRKFPRGWFAQETIY